MDRNPLKKGFKKDRNPLKKGLNKEDRNSFKKGLQKDMTTIQAASMSRHINQDAFPERRAEDGTNLSLFVSLRGTFPFLGHWPFWNNPWWKQAHCLTGTSPLLDFPIKRLRGRRSPCCCSARNNFKIEAGLLDLGHPRQIKQGLCLEKPSTKC